MYKSTITRTLLSALAAGTLLASAHAADGNGHHGHSAEPAAPHAVKSLDVYPLSTDPVTDEPLGERPVVIEHEGRELRFTSEENVETFRQDPAPVLARLDQQIIGQYAAIYAAASCPVSGGPLGSMGETVKKVYGNQLVQFCCGGCTGTFEKNLEANLAKLNQQTLKPQRESYPLQTCIVSGHAIDAMDQPVEIMANGQLVRLCCGGCVADFEENPGRYLNQLKEARVQQSSPTPAQENGHHGH